MQLDDVNKPVWSRDVQAFTNDFAWSDAGERLAIHRVADRVRGARILDIGVGTGRTAWLWRLLSDRYIAIDYTPQMVVAAAALFPGLDVRNGDARDLSEFADGSFDLVTFSLNGLDALDHEGRQRALAEFNRVLGPNGLVLFSTLDKDGFAYDAAPWDAHQRGREAALKRSLIFALRFPSRLGSYRRRYSNWRRLRHEGSDHGGWATGHFAAHEFGLVVHYITPAEERRELAEHGFAVLTMISDVGVELTEASPAGGHTFLHVIAEKRESS